MKRMLHRPVSAGGVHRAELLAAFSHALDITEGQPDGHCIRACWIAQQIGRALGLDEHELGDLYYTVLLKDLGCSSNAARICELYEADDRAFKHGFKTVGTSLAATLHFVFSRTASGRPVDKRAAAIANILVNGHAIAQELILSRCTRGADIARALHFSETVCAGIYHLDEHWDGSGKPGALRGARIPLHSRLALLAQVADVFHSHAGPAAAADEIARRSGSWFDPEICAAFLKLARDGRFWSALKSPFLADLVVASAPVDEQLALDDDYLDDIVAAFGQVIDAKSPFTAGHSLRVAQLSHAIALEAGCGVEQARWVRRAAHLHDVGKLGVSSLVLEKPASLDEREWKEMRAHAEHTRAILGRIRAFQPIADLAAAHHERLDGKGYPRHLRGDEISLGTRIITACDFYDALTADRPYRSAVEREEALAIMAAEVGTSLDAECFALLKAEAGKEPASAS